MHFEKRPSLFTRFHARRARHVREDENREDDSGGDEWTLQNVYPKEAVDQIAGVIRTEAQNRQSPPSTPATEARAPDVMDQLKKASSHPSQ